MLLISFRIFTIHLEVMSLALLDCEESQVTFVDLASSEKLTRAHSKGAINISEAKLLRKNLTTLAEVLNSVNTINVNNYYRNQTPHKPIPYRNSKLTYMLSDVLVPETMIFTYTMIQSNTDHYSEDLRSLNWAHSAKNKQNLQSIQALSLAQKTKT
jgi:hypothetical protein